MLKAFFILFLSVITLHAFDCPDSAIAKSPKKKPKPLPQPAPQPTPAPAPQPAPLPKPKELEFVTGGYHGGRLGNQLFQVAAALSVAFDHKAIPVFPDYAEWKLYDIPENLKNVLFRLNTNKALKLSTTFFEDPNFVYAPIPYTPNMQTRGFFQSEKYFKHNADKILPLFEPRKELVDYLQKKYKTILNHPYTVGVHLRAYKIEDPSILNAMVPITFDYVIKAASLYDEEALFVIFTDSVPWAKEILSSFDRPYYIVENESQYADLYLLSYMKHQIISNSTFSWWAAYLNKNPGKIVVAPRPWFQPNWHNAPGNDNIIPSGWFVLNPFTLKVTPPQE